MHRAAMMRSTMRPTPNARAMSTKSSERAMKTASPVASAATTVAPATMPTTSAASSRKYGGTATQKAKRANCNACRQDRERSAVHGAPRLSLSKKKGDARSDVQWSYTLKVPASICPSASASSRRRIGDEVLPVVAHQVPFSRYNVRDRRIGDPISPLPPDMSIARLKQTRFARGFGVRRREQNLTDQRNMRLAAARKFFNAIVRGVVLRT